MSVFSIMTEFKAYDSVTPVFKKMTSSAGTFQDRVQQMSRSINNSMSIVRQGFSNIRTGIGSFTDKIFNVKNALMALTAGGAIQAITSLSKQWIDFASDLTETQGKIDVVFENSADSLRKWASTSIQTMGLAKQTALDSAALYGDMGVGMGLTRAQAAEMAMTLTRLGADMASFKNISNDMAQTALKSVYTGETESLKNLGIVMTEANLAEYARSIGLKKKIKDLKEAEKVELRYQYVLSRTKTAQGDFARTGGNAANQMRMYQETMKEIQTNWGNVLLPTYTRALVKLNTTLVANMPQIQKGFEDIFSAGVKCVDLFVDIYKSFKTFADFVKDNAPVITTLLFMIGSVALYASINNIAWAVLGLGVNIGTLARAAVALIPTLWGVTAAFAATPIGATILAVGTLTIAVIKLTEAWKTWQDIQEMRRNRQVNGLRQLTAEEQLKLDEYNRTHDVKIEAPSRGTIKGYASGTNYAPGGWALVGENGPELTYLAKGTKVFNHQQSVQMLTNSTKLADYTNVINMSDYTERFVSVPGASFSGNNVIRLELDLTAPDGYEAKVVNAKSDNSYTDFVVKLRGKRKQ